MTQQPEALRLADALRDALSVCASVSVSRDRRIERDGCVLYAQTEEWCKWAEEEVGPKIRAAIDNLHSHCDGQQARITTLEAALRQAVEALEWVIEQGGGPECEHESGGAVCFCKEKAALTTARQTLGGQHD